MFLLLLFIILIPLQIFRALTNKRVKKYQCPKKQHNGIQLQGHVGKQQMNEAVEHDGARAGAVAKHCQQMIKRKGEKPAGNHKGQKRKRR